MINYMIYVTSDLHGFSLSKFQQLLKKANFTDGDFCFVIGDVIDRGNDGGVEILKWLMVQPNFELILGNHESMLLANDFLFDTITDESIENLNDEQMEIFTNWVENGAEPTLKALSETNHETVLDILDYIKDAPLYETVSVGERDFLLTHSGLQNFDKDKSIDDYDAFDLLWNRPTWDDKYYDDIITVFGHTPTVLFGPEHKGKAIITDTWIDIDTGASCDLAPMLLRLDDLKEFYLD